MMRNTRNFAIALFVALVLSACAPSPTQAPEVAETETTAPTATVSPEPTATPEPSLTPTEAILDLEILEWGEFPVMRLADPENTDTRVEVLIRNPNDFPVHINSSEDELRLVNAAGEVVFTNPGSVYYVWEASWMLPGETAALSACVCFWTSGLERQEFETLELVVPLRRANDIAYTPDVEVTLGEWFFLGGSGLKAEITLTNTSDQVLEEFYVRVMVRDANGKHVGVAVWYGGFIAGNDGPIQPGEGDNGVVDDIMIDYMNNLNALEYEVNAIGILAP